MMVIIICIGAGEQYTYNFLVFVFCSVFPVFPAYLHFSDSENIYIFFYQSKLINAHKKHSQSARLSLS